MTADQFIEWRKRLNLNRVQAAEALGMGRNQPKRYEDGTVEIPRYVALACAAIAYGLPAIGEGKP